MFIDKKKIQNVQKYFYNIVFYATNSTYLIKIRTMYVVTSNAFLNDNHLCIYKYTYTIPACN